MSALVTLAHGSRHPGADVATLSFQAGAKAVAYLDFSEDTLAAVAKRLQEHLVVVPLLFSNAFHARFDAPQAAREAEAFAPITLARPLGMGQDIIAALPEPQATPVLFHVGSKRSTEAQALAQHLGWLEVAATQGGVAELRALSSTHPRLHVIPLFVTDGLLLAQAREADYPGEVIFDQPLGTKLSPIIRARFEEAV
ncbi:sirohydrochlorin chelatase [Corynebacterium pelargi]|uniref:Sirohydrochlorin ferrochelatase n=1 Tax=Corynebacterium pelargi TaxID=1471400 RepID=A0A410W6G7_9CORY|nr:CbiX/SirB N-terminal domain-containing protein [Corynebacterium pelargi]QAU51543.1 Sirohydrochlorin ferrochelatase [Corynebacterium pelargi]GGG82264.1 hypothetical protein GCM10007338_21410 [Corynebacterium pelargi]